MEEYKKCEQLHNVVTVPKSLRGLKFQVNCQKKEDFLYSLYLLSSSFKK